MALELKASIPRGTNQELRIYSGEYYGIEVIDIRWYQEKDGEMVPSRKGVRFNKAEGEHLLQVLERIMKKEEF
jgi:hypothetical protein